MKRENDLILGHSAQAIMMAENDAPAACGAACGTQDKPNEEKPAACGSACGAADKEEAPKAACGSACGTGDKN